MACGCPRLDLDYTRAWTSWYGSWEKCVLDIQAQGAANSHRTYTTSKLPCRSFPPICSVSVFGLRRRDYPMLVVVFGFPDIEELGTILSLDLPLQNSFSAGCMRSRVPLAYGYGNLMSKLISAAEEVSWEGCVREHMLWQTYSADCVKNSVLED